MQLNGAEQVPHDLWAAADLPPLTWVERMTVVLHQFDLTFRIDADTKSIVIEPLPTDIHQEKDYAAGAKPEERLAEWQLRAPDATIELRGKRIFVRGTVEDHAALTAKPSMAPTTPPPSTGTQVYTLKVNGEPLNKVLPPLTRQLKLEL